MAAPARGNARTNEALPVLAGTDIVGHIAPKADRPNRKLPIVSRQIRRGHSVTAGTKQLATFLSLRTVAIARD